MYTTLTHLAGVTVITSDTAGLRDRTQSKYVRMLHTHTYTHTHMHTHIYAHAHAHAHTHTAGPCVSSVAQI